tara:strand:+ start:750 stop:2186 length:1437 start_codon:yes stop_codon:yes gene_type:complete
MATIIEQQPLYSTFPVGQDVMFSVSNELLVANELQVKFIAKVYMTDSLPPVLIGTEDRVGVFKTTPNNAGVGMFDFSPIIESYVKADNLARGGSQYKGNNITSAKPPPLHLTDKFCSSRNIIRYFAVKFSVQYLGAGGDPNVVDTAPGSFETSDSYLVFNGYLKHSNVLRLIGLDFGYNMTDFNLNSKSKKFLTNAPIIQYANQVDYGTVGISLYNTVQDTTFNPDGFGHLRFTYYDSSGVVLNNEVVKLNPTTGGFEYKRFKLTKNKMIYAGIYPGNLQNWSSIFRALISAGTLSYYTVVAQTDMSPAADVDISETYTINVNCPTLKGYEPIRLGWLNQWGAWDYYTFTMKSTKTISTQGSTYNQLAGTWNESIYRIDSYKGGKKAFRVNATEKITMNTDFVNEAEGEWFQDLINSPEVYILKGYENIDEREYALNQYVTPVKITTSSYTKKTIANDKLMQYTFEVEKSKTLRTQAV